MTETQKEREARIQSSPQSQNGTFVNPNEISSKLFSNDQTRVVEIGGKTFCEGMLEATLNEINDDIFEEIGLKRLNKTKKHPFSNFD
jgi:hypothetical protein